MRDYYLVPGAGTIATTEHWARLQKLESVLAELREIGEHVAGLD